MLAGVNQAWRPLSAQWLGERVLLCVDDRSLIGVGLRQNRITTPSWSSLMPAQALQRGMPELVDVLGDFLGDLLLSQGLIQQPIRVALPLEASQWRLIEWPLDQWPDDPLEALRTIDPQLNLPFALADAAIDLQPLPGSPLQALLVAAPRALVEGWIEVMNIAGLTLERLLPAQVCLREALLPALRRLDPQDGVAVLVPQASGRCLLQLWRQGLPRYERELSSEASQLERDLLQSIAYYGSQDNRFQLKHCWLAGAMEQQPTIAAALDVPLELLDCDPYDSQICRGLALVR